MMKKKYDDYQVVPYPKLRRKPMTHGLIEVDVTRAREFLRERKHENL